MGRTFKKALDAHGCAYAAYNVKDHLVRCRKFPATGATNFHLELCTPIKALAGYESCTVVQGISDFTKPYLCKHCKVSQASLECDLINGQCPNRYSQWYSEITCPKAKAHEFQTISSALETGCTYASARLIKDTVDIKCTFFNPYRTCNLEMATTCTATTCPKLAKYRGKTCRYFNNTPDGQYCAIGNYRLHCDGTTATAYTPETCPHLAEFQRAALVEEAYQSDKSTLTGFLQRLIKFLGGK